MVAGLAATSVLLCLGVESEGTPGPAGPPLYTAGIAGVAGVAFGPSAYRLTLPPHATGRYAPGTSLLQAMLAPPTAAPGGIGFGPAEIPTANAAALAARTRAWLRAGAVPGRTPGQRAMAERALLDLALLTEPSGASIAAPFGPWHLVWPRDASWHAVALAATGHGPAARRILGFLARVQHPDGRWTSRYYPDGRPVLDGRPDQIDALGWVSWATWMWWQTSAERSADTARLGELWPMVVAAADAATAALGPDGLPRPSADYWEQRESRVTLGSSVPLLLGLRSAADLAAGLGESASARRWADAARRLDAAIGETFGPGGFRRYAAAGSSADSAVTWLRPPLAPLHSVGGELLDAAVDDAERDLLMPSGGLRPGDIPRVGGVAWTPATALFALAAAGRGDDAGFQRWFEWLAAHRTRVGALPEKVSNLGRPASVAPLGWTNAIVLIALSVREGRVPTPPIPRP